MTKLCMLWQRWAQIWVISGLFSTGAHHHFWLCYCAVACKNMRITILLHSSLTSEWKRWVLARSLMIAVSFHLSGFMTPQRFSLGCCLLNWDWLKQYESYIQHCTAEREICSFCCLSVLLLSFFDRPWGLVTVSQNAFHCTSAI